MMTTALKASVIPFVATLISMPSLAQNQPPQANISNGILHAGLYLPDPVHGFYRGTRFDWSGVIHSLTYKGHDYYGPWFTKTDPKVSDFIFDGPDIVAGPCSAITGPVQEFVWQEKALGFDQAKAGGTFIKIGVGVLRKPDDGEYSPYRLYPIVDSGKWHVQKNDDSVEFIQELSDPASGYGYRYTKTVRLVKGKPEMVLEHKLENTGRIKIQTSVYDHNFLVLDKQPVGPDYTITLPFAISTKNAERADLSSIKDNRFTYRQNLTGHDTVAADFTGFGATPSDYKITIENRQAGAGMRVEGDRPLSKEALWSIRSVLAMEPFIDMSIEPGKAFTWSYTYTYYLLTEASK
jgi:hypothetical protein